jgi:hypothetical protein
MRKVNWQRSRSLRPLVGWACAVYAASALLTVYTVAGNYFGFTVGGGATRYSLGDLVSMFVFGPLFLFLIAGFFSAIPSWFLISWSETNSRRSLALSILAGALIAVSVSAIIVFGLRNPNVPLFPQLGLLLGYLSATGALSGWIYWSVAGQFAGMWREDSKEIEDK